MKFFALATLLLSTALAATNNTIFQHYKVVDVPTESEYEVRLLDAFLQSNPDIDMWRDPRVGRSAHLLMRTEQIEQLPLDHSIFVDDVEEAISHTFRKSTKRAKSIHSQPHLQQAEDDWYTQYHDYKELDERLFKTANMYQNVTSLNVELFKIGKTVEGRDINGISFGGTGSANPVRIVWNALQHAREWVGPPVLHFIMDRFLAGYAAGDKRLVSLLDQIEFHIIPVVNVDGYRYTWLDGPNRFWRKNRAYYGGRFVGVDLNRNWDYRWGGIGASEDPESITYRGPSAASEPEVAALADYIKNLDNVKGFIDWHSYGQYILHEWGWTSDLPDDIEQMLAMAGRMQLAMRQVEGRPWTYGPSGVTLYPTSGTAPDYTYGELGIIHSYTMELLGEPGGFALPPEYIVSAAEEGYAGALVFAFRVLQDIADGLV